MLKIIRAMWELDCAQLAAVYEESISRCAAEQYSSSAPNIQLLLAQQDFYASIKQYFAQELAAYALWLPEGSYASALRIEAYRDGYLIVGLETLPGARGKGCATALLGAVLAYLSGEGSVKVYAHIDRINRASIRVHEKCGFSRILDHAVLLDGSVSRAMYTYCYEK